MKKIFSGVNTLDLVQCTNPNKCKYIVLWGKEEIVDEDGGKSYSYLSEEFSRKPTIDDIKELILGYINAKVDKKILEGFEWNGSQVWLTRENQFNYKAAFDEAVRTNGGNLPVTFKFGSTDSPVYHEFKTMEELGLFYRDATTYVNTCLSEGWAEKDGMDFTPYDEALKNL